MLINLCSGQRKFEKPWINVDINPRWEPDVLADGASMPMFENGSAELIVIHHGLEHFNLGNADQMIRECYRILKPTGSLIVMVPDMRALAQRFITRQIDEYTFMVNTYGAYMGNDADTHKWGFSIDGLMRYLHSTVIQWTKLKPFDWRAIPGADIARDWWIAGVEAVK